MLIYLTNCDLVVEISDRWLDLRDINWSLNSKTNGKMYARGNYQGKRFLLHVLIGRRLGLKGQIDHIDRNPLNCRDDNLRSATHGQNKANSECPKNNTLGIKGVSWSEVTKSYQVYCGGLYLGQFDSRKEASDAYDRCATQLWGPFACLNNYTGPR